MSLIIVNIKEWLDTQPETFDSDQQFLESVKSLEKKIWREAFQNMGIPYTDSNDWDHMDNPYSEEDI